MRKELNYNEIQSELLKVRLLLKIYTVLHVLALVLFFTNSFQLSVEIMLVVHCIFLLFFVSFIWLRMPMDKHDKVGETVLIIIFGLFALWMWIPNEKKLKEMIIKVNEN
jgi:hypothetical protein